MSSIKHGVIQLLAANTEIKKRTALTGAGLRIYEGRVPEGVPLTGGTIIVGKVSAEHDYGLAGEAPSQFTVVQVDCFDDEPADAESLDELVASIMHGAPAIGVTAGDHHIESAEIAGEHEQLQKPYGASDDWRPRCGRDYRIHHWLISE